MKEIEIHSKVDQVLNSVNNIETASANPYLLTKVLQQLENRSGIYIQPSVARKIIVGICVLMALNIGIILFTSQSFKVQSNTSSETYLNHTYSY